MRPVNLTAVWRARAGARWTWIVLVWALLMSAVLCAADGLSTGDAFEVSGKIPDPGANLSVGGSFQVQGKQALPTNGLGNREFTLDPRGTKQEKSSGGCPCQGLFADGFETGDLSAWSSSVGIGKNN